MRRKPSPIRITLMLTTDPPILTHHLIPYHLTSQPQPYYVAPCSFCIPTLFLLTLPYFFSPYPPISSHRALFLLTVPYFFSPCLISSHRALFLLTLSSYFFSPALFFLIIFSSFSHHVLIISSYFFSSCSQWT